MDASVPAISVRGVSMGYGSRVLLEDASFDVARGEIVVILGGSGSGKSSLMKVLIGLVPPRSGDVLIGGRSIVKATAEERASIQRGLGIMYQSGALLDNVRFPLDEFTDLPPAARHLAAHLLLDLVEMPKAAGLMPGELSGGMLKRAGIARALALGADILLLDEPSAGLDPITAANLDQTILALRDSMGVTCVVVTHELRSIYRIADRAVMLDPVSRRIVADGKPAQLRDHSPDARVRQFFNAQPDTAAKAA
jgi:phospholipid/cholesterol/gamma-HCH transport system ATP-binding protein